MPNRFDREAGIRSIAFTVSEAIHQATVNFEATGEFSTRELLEAIDAAVQNVAKISPKAFDSFPKLQEIMTSSTKSVMKIALATLAATEFSIRDDPTEYDALVAALPQAKNGTISDLHIQHIMQEALDQLKDRMNLEEPTLLPPSPSQGE